MVSIVASVFNVERYIDDCIRSSGELHHRGVNTCVMYTKFQRMILPLLLVGRLIKKKYSCSDAGSK